MSVIEDKPEQRARALLRKSFLQCLSAVNGQEATFLSTTQTDISGHFLGGSREFEKIVLKDNSRQVVLVETKDISSIQFVFPTANTNGLSGTFS